uniref:Uncharacterized protein n=1 Tax=Anguilla anguilla TaxID=7936 RepID=A0A0E9T415_ANGAN
MCMNICVLFSLPWIGGKSVLSVQH